MSDQVLIIDCGSMFTKYGVCSSPESSSGLLLPSSFKNGQLESPTYVLKKNFYDPSFQFPLREGQIQDFRLYIELIHQIINKYANIHSNSSISNIVLTEQEVSLDRDREKLTEIMFEQFDFKNVFLARKAACAMYDGLKSSSNLTGIVLHSGDSYTSATPVYDGYTIVHPFRKKYESYEPHLENEQQMFFKDEDFEFYQNSTIVPVGGFNLLYPIIERISRSYDQIDNFNFTKWFEFSQSDNAGPLFDFSDFDQNSTSVNFLNTTVPVEKDKIIEIMFYSNNSQTIPQNNLLSNQLQNRKCNVRQIINNSLEGIDDNLKEQLQKNIILSGGNTSHFGFAQRVAKEFEDLEGLKVIESKELASFVIWNGAKNMVFTPSFENRWANREEYMENGPWIGEMKFF